MQRGRFAPTPSGELHIGNAMTALLAWLQIRHEDGTFVLRMEDLDGPRSRPEYARQILDDLRWLGLDWDEGPDIGGPNGPYGQSERNDFYEAAFDRLNHEGWLYPCFCSRKDLRAIASAPHGRNPGYPGTCRRLTLEERRRKSTEKTPSFRFAIPDRDISFDDGVQGRRGYSAGFGGDFVVRRADGIMSYQLAVVADDAAMQITDVLRGADLLDSTPWQILLHQALGLPIPRFAHVPLIYGPDGKRLSKRHGPEITLPAIRKAGTSPEKVVGFLANLLGLIERPEPIKPADLIVDFDLKVIPKESVRIDASWLRDLSSKSN